MTVLSIGLGSMVGGPGGERMTCGAVGTSEWREQPAVGHPGIWYFGVQEGDWGWRPRCASSVQRQ